MKFKKIVTFVLFFVFIIQVNSFASYQNLHCLAVTNIYGKILGIEVLSTGNFLFKLNSNEYVYCDKKNNMIKFSESNNKVSFNHRQCIFNGKYFKELTVKESYGTILLTLLRNGFVIDFTKKGILVIEPKTNKVKANLLFPYVNAILNYGIVAVAQQVVSTVSVKKLEITKVPSKDIQQREQEKESHLIEKFSVSNRLRRVSQFFTGAPVSLEDRFFDAAIKGDRRKLHACLKEGAKLDSADSKGDTILHKLAKRQNYAILNFLIITAGASDNRLLAIKNKKGETFMDLADDNTKKEVYKVLKVFFRTKDYSVKSVTSLREDERIVALKVKQKALLEEIQKLKKTDFDFPGLRKIAQRDRLRMYDVQAKLSAMAISGDLAVIAEALRSYVVEPDSKKVKESIGQRLYTVGMNIVRVKLEKIFSDSFIESNYLQAAGFIQRFQDLQNDRLALMNSANILESYEELIAGQLFVTFGGFVDFKNDRDAIAELLIKVEPVSVKQQEQHDRFKDTREEIEVLRANLDMHSAKPAEQLQLLTTLAKQMGNVEAIFFVFENIHNAEEPLASSLRKMFANNKFLSKFSIESLYYLKNIDLMLGKKIPIILKAEMVNAA